MGVGTELITSFSSPQVLRAVLFAPRKVLEPINGSIGIWWYFKWHRVLLAQALHRRLADGAPAIIYAQSPTAAEAALEARRDAGQRVVLAVHFGESVARGWTRRGVIPRGGRVDSDIRGRERSTIPLLDGLVHVSLSGRQELLEQVPEASSVPFEVIPNFVTRPESPSIAATRDVITLGSLAAPKNQRYLVDVIAEARAQGRDVTATIVGEGMDRASIEARIKERSVGDLIDMAGYVANGSKLLADHRVYAHSSTYESFSLAAVEGLAYGRPLIAGAVGGMPEIFDGGVEGRFWPLDSPRRGAELLIDLLDDQQTYDRMAIAARTRFEERLDADVVVPRLYEFLQRIGGNSRS